MVRRTTSSRAGLLFPSSSTAIYAAETYFISTRRSSKSITSSKLAQNCIFSHAVITLHFLDICQLFKTPWLEYVDHWAVEQNQLKAVHEWERVTFRDPENLYQRCCQSPVNVAEAVDPLQRIFRRLSSYELPVPPPALSRNQPVLNCVARECLYNAAAVVDLIKPHLKVVLDYAQTYNLLVSEHTAVDCSFLELVPTLYRVYDNQVTLHALCDPAPPGQRRSRSGTPPTVHCAGPAVIRIKVSLKNNK